MKKLFLFILPFLFISSVKADTIINIQYGGSNYSEYHYLTTISDWSASYSILESSTDVYLNCNSRLTCYNDILSAFNSSNKQYYSISVAFEPSVPIIRMNAIFFDFSSNESYTQDVYSTGTEISRFFFYKNNSPSDIINIVLSGWSDPNYNNFYLFYDTNFNFINTGDYIFKGFYDNENDNYANMLHVYDNQPLPKIKDLIEYSSWSDYENNHLSNYTTVNLDDYEYVLLSLKDYSQSVSFQTNLQVKGQIGITPIYNYGQTSKDAITGSQVQDRCNISYDNFTAYPFYILQSDIQNNSVYAVKSCSANSSFKFDSTIFNITYVTLSNLSDPVITINGNQYHTIPYADLPSSATQNEENNYIPGQSGSATDTGGLDSAIKSAQNNLSIIWNTITYFTDFVGLLFSALPVELRTVLISAFVVCITLGIIKLFVGH